jgi:hypothetical protein
MSSHGVGVDTRKEGKRFWANEKSRRLRFAHRAGREAIFPKFLRCHNRANGVEDAQEATVAQGKKTNQIYSPLLGISFAKNHRFFEFSASQFHAAFDRPQLEFIHARILSPPATPFLPAAHRPAHLHIR